MSLQSKLNPTTEYLKRAEKPIRVLIAEDSATIRYYLTNLLDNTPGIEVVGQARDGEEALEMVAELKPDVVSMDVRMPHMDGMQATRQIMMRHPTPIVIVSGLVQTDVELSFKAISAGALAVVEKPPDRQSPDFPEKYQQLTKTLIAMSQVKVIRRNSTGKLADPTEFDVPATGAAPEVIAIGASAGGPRALSELLSALPGDFPIPIVIAQHIPHEFVLGLAGWLHKVSPFDVQVVTDGQKLSPGVVHLSPGTAHILVCRKSGVLYACLDTEQGIHRYQPSVDVLFDSVAQSCGKRALGIVLTGMGDDGANGLLNMRRAGALTLAQDEASSTVFGMPAAAIERGAIDRVLSLAALPKAVCRVVLRTG